MKKLIGLAVLCALFSGCATSNGMAFNRSSKTIDTSAKSVVLMSLEVSRPDHSRFEPKPGVIFFEVPNAKERKDRQNFRISSSDDVVKENGHDVYLARMSILPGKYKLQGVWGMANGFPFVSSFFVPLVLDVDIKPNTITYIGRVSATLRARHGAEFRAGPLIPLVDQAISGMSGSTWEVVTEDKSAQDLAAFRTAFPVLGNTPVDNVILPQYDRAAAQKWSDNPSAATTPATEVPPATLPTAAPVAAPAPDIAAAPITAAAASPAL